MIDITFPVGPLQCNCTILACERTREALVIDPGDEAPRILAALQKEALTVRVLLHTHAHFDHVGATKALKETLPEKPLVALHPSDLPLYNNLALQGKMFGMALSPGVPLDKQLEDAEEITFGHYRLQVLHTPGHTPGSVCFHLSLPDGPLLLSGDTLFYRSVGRTDLWGGDTSQLQNSIRHRLFTLDGDTRVRPGHGRETHIGEEKKLNPFVA